MKVRIFEPDTLVAIQYKLLVDSMPVLDKDTPVKIREIKTRLDGTCIDHGVEYRIGYCREILISL